MGNAGVRYAIGIDVGERSVGLAAIEFDDNDLPLRRLEIVTHRHDGGLDPDKAKSGYSRKKSSGIARRTRRLRANRTRRLAALDRLLTDLGLPVPTGEVPQTYEAWRARADLIDYPITDQDELRDKLVLAVRHIARHRGWKNPWWSFDTLWDAPVPTSNMTKIRENASDILGPLPANVTIGQIGGSADSPSILLRPRNDRKRTEILSEKVMQEDQLEEIRRYWEVQDLPKEWLRPISQAVFFQTKPRVSRELVGKDDLPGMEKFSRATRASLEFQEFRVRSTVANLRITEKHSASRKLTPDEKELVSNKLLTWSDSESPTWADVAEMLNVESRAIRRPEFDDSPMRSAPFDRTSERIRSKLQSSSKPEFKELLRWWDDADRMQRGLLVAWIADATLGEEYFEESGLSDVIDGLSLEVLSELESVDIESGRAAYSAESLAILNERMAATDDDLFEARKAMFNVPDDWKPALPRFEDQTGQPVVDRVVRIVGKFIRGCVTKYGTPERVVIEHVRSALMGGEALADYKREVNSNRDVREQLARELREQGVTDRPTRRDTTRMRIVQEQGSQCLYCGVEININCELDHIVPRATGGSNRRDNLAAVCRECNRLKTKIPFAVWARQTNRLGVSVDEAISRVNSLLPFGRTTPRELRRLQKSIKQRLAQTEEDLPIDERSMESTAYSALEVRDRIRQFLESRGDGEANVVVFRGSITSAARKAGGIDKVIQLRDKDIKDRGDFRHHAIDAAVMTIVTTSVSQTLAIRESLRYAHKMTGDHPEWKEFRGDYPAQERNFVKFEEAGAKLAGILREAIDNDKIPVVSQLRLKPEVGKIHDDTIRELKLKKVNEEWTENDIRCIVEDDAYLAFLDKLGKRKSLPGEEAVELANELDLETVDGNLKVFYTHSRPLMVVRGGCAAISNSLHHFRIYAWKDKKGVTKFGQMRVFAAEFRKMWGDPRKVDIFTEPIPQWAQSYRELPLAVRKGLQEFDAVQIGWLVPNDELELDVSELAAQNNVLSKFLSAFPEKRWRLRGSYNLRNLLLSPVFLSAEVPDLDKRDKGFQKAVSSGLPVSSGSLLDSDLTVIRRTALGRPRWSGGSATSFSILDVANALLD